MTVNDLSRDEIVANILALINQRLKHGEATQVGELAQRYFKNVAPGDLAAREIVDLYGVVVTHWRLAQTRPAETEKLRVFNPSVDQHGWQSTHTVVQMVNDDMPFLVDSLTNELNRLGLGIHLVVHPVISITRASDNSISQLGEGLAESLIYIEVDRQSGQARLAEIEQAIARVLKDVRLAVRDWRAMNAKIPLALADMAGAAAKVDEAEFDEAKAFLEWLGDNHFTFLGYSQYQLEGDGETLQLRRIKGSGLGILRGKDDGERSASFQAMPLAARLRAQSPSPLLGVTKAHAKSTVHRASFLDYVGCKIYDAQGKVVGENRFLGLFTSAAYNLSPRFIPLLRRKIEQVINRAGFEYSGHSGKALVNTLETYPRDELFQASLDELYGTATQILHLQERQRTRLFLRRDPYERFVAALVYVPRERYNTAMRQRFQAALERAIGSHETEFQVQLSESALARILFTIKTPQGGPSTLDGAALEAELIEASQGWADQLRQSLLDREGEEDGVRLYNDYGRTLPVSYQERVDPRAALPDILAMERLQQDGGQLEMSLYRRLEDSSNLVRFKLIRADHAIHLSDALPILESMGLRVLHEEPFQLTNSDGRQFAIHDFGMQPTKGGGIDTDAVRPAFQAVFEQVWTGRAENDGFNRLVLAASISARSIEILRTYCKYLLQIGVPFSQAYIENTLSTNPHLTQALSQLFEARFDPEQISDRENAVADIIATIEAGLQDVSILDEDRIIRHYLGLIQATLRTNAFQTDDQGQTKPYLSLKFDPARVPGLPQPKPAFEIFVYAPDFEGVHLRGGKVARGGLRWSDRREDFRTEVLGLMKAQMVKNSVIVPVGAKGGFVVKRPPNSSDRAAFLAEGVRCYKLFLSGLLDITDNQLQGKIIPPENVVRHDEDDPYLVVAADKGTATFSDFANGVSQDYGFWLGDAFASGGSAGYDHKGMGITAKGAWESVKRHFREMGIDTQNDPFTVVGIGDMSGDVFGNGMILSDQIRLIAAFDHRHVFIDPDPDAAKTFIERSRLFDLGRSSWDDYDRSLISEGGGIYPRSLKSIPLSPQAAAALGTEPGQIAPLDLLKKILLAPVDLWWNGGIGTYIKAASETHQDAQDRANDTIRVNGADLRCKVVGEGGNLGCTQKGRIEFAAKGGRINTDFIDNSAGVDCSDHEVNIKILLGGIVDAGELTIKQRDRLLVEMTDEVSELCLRDNILQNLALSMIAAQGESVLDAQIRFMRKLEVAGRLDREIELLPDDKALEQRRAAGQALTRPEAAVLLAYSKTTLYADLLTTELPDRDYFNVDLAKYFPRAIRRQYGEELKSHRLRREIVATWLANSIVNRGLDVFMSELTDETGSTLAEIAMAYVVTRDSFGLLPLWSDIERLGVEVDAGLQVTMLNDARATLMRGTRWFLSNLAQPFSIRESIQDFGPNIQSLMQSVDDVLAPSQKVVEEGTAAALVESGLPEDLARRVAAMPLLLAAADIVVVTQQSAQQELTEVGQIYFALDDALHLSWLRSQLHAAVIQSRWERMAISGLEDMLAKTQQRLTLAALANKADQQQGGVANWAQEKLTGVGRLRALMGEIEAAPEADLAMLSVAVAMVERLSPQH